MKKLFPHVFVVSAFIFILFLGIWQVNRRAEKQDLMTEIDSRMYLAPIAPAAFDGIDKTEFRKMTATGKYQHKKEILLLNKAFNGKQGQHLLTPFELDNGETIVIDRGWVPPDKEPVRPEGETSVTGVIRATQHLNTIGRAITLQNDPSKQVWFWLDLPAIYKSMGLPQKDYYLDLISEETVGKAPSTAHNVQTYPIPLPKKITLYNEHLQYAITWFSLSFALLIMYYFRFWHKK